MSVYYLFLVDITYNIDISYTDTTNNSNSNLANTVYNMNNNYDNRLLVFIMPTISIILKLMLAILDLILISGI